MMLVTRLEKYKMIRYPLALGLLGLSLVLMSVLFYRLCVDYLQLAQSALLQIDLHASVTMEVIKPFCGWTIVILATVLPILTTQTLSQELHQKTFQLWANSSLRAYQIVLGKFFSLMLIFSVLLLYMLLLIGTLSIETSLDWGMVGSCALGITLIASSFVSFGLFVSSMIASPLLATGITFLSNIAWILLEWLNPFSKGGYFMAKELSLLSHNYHFLNGILYTPDIIYYIFFSCFWLSMTELMINSKMAHTQ